MRTFLIVTGLSMYLCAFATHCASQEVEDFELYEAPLEKSREYIKNYSSNQTERMLKSESCSRQGQEPKYCSDPSHKVHFAGCVARSECGEFSQNIVLNSCWCDARYSTEGPCGAWY